MSQKITRNKLIKAIEEHYRNVLTDPSVDHALTIWPNGFVEHRTYLGTLSYGENEYFKRRPHELTLLRTKGIDVLHMEGEPDVDEMLEIDGWEGAKIDETLADLRAAFG